ncbi:MAG: 3-oxoacyl-[acyl-carrier-protein] reductase [Paracoccaceae bacterium]|nr:3-oxoacyl-[acyl-carrier-protein] reductase [Paracoccaceae bacterium]
MFSLDKKNALVTGASGDIGRSIAVALHEAGAQVIISGTRLEPLEALKRELGERVHIILCDLSDKDEVRLLISNAIETLGSIDILINNAGITQDNLFMRMSDDEWNNVINVNLSSTMQLCRGVLRGMMKSRWGRIVNISSVVGVTGNPGQANYAASKAGVIGMSKSLAYEVASRGITVNCVAPGFISSAMTDKLNDKQKDSIISSIPSNCMGNSKDVAAAVLYLASTEASYVTGQTLHVNGGLAMI